MLFNYRVGYFLHIFIYTHFPCISQGKIIILKKIRIYVYIDSAKALADTRVQIHNVVLIKVSETTAI